MIGLDSTLLRFLPATILFCSIASAFDTGYHQDVTRAVLREHGFSKAAADIVVLQNWLTDYYGAHTLRSVNDRIERAYQLAENLHFDNLANQRVIQWYWRRLQSNTLDEIKNNAPNDPLGALVALGVSLHAVQDFYSHSNWVKKMRPTPEVDSYAVNTYLAHPQLADIGLRTGVYGRKPGVGEIAHGGYSDPEDKGLNKDAQGTVGRRKRWDEAYVYAYCATAEWVALIKKQVTPAFWDKVRKYEHAPKEERTKDMERDLLASREISLWIDAFGEDGHWKGEHSGDNTQSIEAAVAWVSKPRSFYKSLLGVQMRHEAIAKGLPPESQVDPGTENVEPFSHNRTALVIEFKKINEKDDLGTFEPGIDVLGDADFFSRVVIDGVQYDERVLQGKSTFEYPWKVIHFFNPVESNSISVSIEVWDEDDRDPKHNDQCDINPVAGKKSIQFALNTVDGKLTGDFGGAISDGDLATSGAKPDSDRAEMILRIFMRPLKRIQLP